MGLFVCPDCGHSVSQTAVICPGCGFQLRKPKRGVMGKIFKWVFIAFNAIMAFWIISYWSVLGELSANTTSTAEEAGTAIGGAIGTTALLMLWALGDIILGLLVMFTRPKIK